MQPSTVIVYAASVEAIRVLEVTHSMLTLTSHLDTLCTVATICAGPGALKFNNFSIDKLNPGIGEPQNRSPAPKYPPIPRNKVFCAERWFAKSATGRQFDATCESFHQQLMMRAHIYKII
eukprot:5705589-Amphidinium_carterae.1